MLHRPKTETARLEPDWSAITRRLGFAEVFQSFADGAAERDTERRPVFEEAEALKARGFCGVRLPKDLGGAGISLAELYALTRDLATADPNIAHIFRNHFHAVEQHVSTRDTPFSAHILTLAARGQMFGVAFSEMSKDPAGGREPIPSATLDWSEARGGYEISGTKIYSTGNMYADYLFASAMNARTGQPAQFFIEAAAPGVLLEDDWDGFGQRLTGSGRTVFKKVLVAEESLFGMPRGHPAAPPTYFFTFHQVYLTAVISGIVNRVMIDAVNLVRNRSRNYYHGLAERPADEVEIQAVIGRIAAYRSAVNAVVDRAVAALDLAWAAAAGPEGHALALEATIAAAEAKVVADEVAANLASLLIDVSSGSGVSTTKALDRHWRNIKVIASHNPRIYKERVLGDHYLNGALPPTGAFF
jgi:alkylation response protein AidB-like acyl-CoA dehydrogenase